MCWLTGKKTSDASDAQTKMVSRLDLILMLCDLIFPLSALFIVKSSLNRGRSPLPPWHCSIYPVGGIRKFWYANSYYDTDFFFYSEFSMKSLYKRVRNSTQNCFIQRLDKRGASRGARDPSEYPGSGTFWYNVTPRNVETYISKNFYSSLIPLDIN